jgi:uncharacterized protein (DUF302 family)
VQTAYGFGTRLAAPYEEAVRRARAALQEEGFGVLTEIDVRATMKQKIGAEFRKYVILGACNPQLAHRALEVEPEIGLLLPCNVIVYEEDGESVVSVVDPVVALGIVANDRLLPIATEARTRLEHALARLNR